MYTLYQGLHTYVISTETDYFCGVMNLMTWIQLLMRVPWICVHLHIICSLLAYQSAYPWAVAVTGQQGMLQLSLHHNVISHSEMQPVLWLQDLHIQLALGGIVLDRPGTHDGMLILKQCSNQYNGLHNSLMSGKWIQLG